MAAKFVPSEIAPRPAGRLSGAIGSTPLVEMPRFARGAARVFAKLEWFNPGGSVKDRIAKSMLDDAEERGLLAPGGTIVEATSGNTGVALALLAASRGYRCVIVMPEGSGEVKARLMIGGGRRGRADPRRGSNVRSGRPRRRDRRFDPRLLPSRPVPESREPPDALRNDRTRDRRADRGSDRRVGRRRRNDGHLHRRRPLS